MSEQEDWTEADAAFLRIEARSVGRVRQVLRRISPEIRFHENMWFRAGWQAAKKSVAAGSNGEGEQ